MADAATLVEQIRDKQRQLAEAEARVAQLRKELDDARAVLIGPGVVLPSSRHPLTNSTDMAEAVLRTAGKPMHVTDIIKGIQDAYGIPVRYATLVSNITRLRQKGKTFEKVAPNTFGLLEWAEKHDADVMFGREEDERLQPVTEP